jgi:hypothetical protein
MAGTMETWSPSLSAEADVLLVHVDIDEAAQLAALVHEALAHPGKLLLEVGDHGIDGVALALHLCVALRDLAQRGRNPHGHRHRIPPSRPSAT